MRNYPLLIACGGLALVSHTSTAQTTFRRANVDSTGQLRIVLSNQHTISPARASDQVAFEQVSLSSDRRVVGWVGLYPNCCTTYPIPMNLVLLRVDGGRTVIATDMTVWQWGFAPDGRSVVIRQAPLHGDAPMFYELHDMRTGRLIATAETDSASHAALPSWTRAAMKRDPP
jgi:hypothetical protein